MREERFALHAETAGTQPCPLCPRHCAPPEGRRGWCGARRAKQGRVHSESYGQIAALALDPVKKKPLARYCPEGMVLSVGSYGCNLECPFCQNHGIAHPGGTMPTLRTTTPGALVRQAAELRPQGNIGLAYTYNEPIVGYEFVRDTARLARAEGLKNILVTNAWMCEGPWLELLAETDALNIDLKCFCETGYKTLGGDLATVQRNIGLAHSAAHLEVTTLVVPGFSDGEMDMEAEAAWLASLSPDIPLHLSRYFPRWQAAMPATPMETMDRLASIARRHLNYVYLGNC